MAEQLPVTQKKHTGLKIYYLVMCILLLFVFFGYFARYLVVFLDSVYKVSDTQSVVEFRQSVTEVHGKWLVNKGSVVTLHLVITPDLKDRGELRFFVSDSGWPLGLASELDAGIDKKHAINCEALWFSMQSQDGQKTLLVEEMFDKHNITTGCIYYKLKHKRKYMLFEYRFNNGEVITKPADTE